MFAWLGSARSTAALAHMFVWVAYKYDVHLLQMFAWVGSVRSA